MPGLKTIDGGKEGYMNLGWERGLGRSRLGEDERGTVLVQFAIYIIAIMGMVGLALDGSRFLLLHNSLQDLADAAALAGAADLDGSTNASNAINDANLWCSKNSARWWDVTGVNCQSVHVYATLADVDAGTDTDSNPRKAQFIKVTTGAWQVAPSFLIAVGAVSKNSAQATAVAQASITICKPLPVLLCNPQEPNPFSATPGQLFQFSLTGNAGGYSPGDFNLVDAPNGTGDQAIENYLSQQNGNTCIVSGVNPAQGQKTNATIIGINVRFDQQPNGNTTGLDQTPAPIKIDGTSPIGGGHPANSCRSPGGVSAQSLPLPSDTFNAPIGSTSSSSGPPSTASLTAYWTNHHPGTLPAGITTRYQIYQLEVAGTGNAGIWNTDAVEPHGPQCAPVSAGDVNRRIESVAVVDCQFWNVRGNAVNNIPINTYLDFFLSQPSDGKIYAEYVQTRSIGAGNATGLHLNVQLVR